MFLSSSALDRESASFSTGWKLKRLEEELHNFFFFFCKYDGVILTFEARALSTWAILSLLFLSISGWLFLSALFLLFIHNLLATLTLPICLAPLDQEVDALPHRVLVVVTLWLANDLKHNQPLFLMLNLLCINSNNRVDRQAYSGRWANLLPSIMTSLTESNQSTLLFRWPLLLPVLPSDLL